MARLAVWPPSVRTLAAVAALCLGLAACGSTGATKNTASVSDFGLIEVGKVHLQIAADGRSAVVQVETNPPTVCAIAYGRTASLGSIADDPNMGGTAISRHIVVLGGLAPGTTYRFLLTATDARRTGLPDPGADHLHDAARERRSGPRHRHRGEDRRRQLAVEQRLPGGERGRRQPGDRMGLERRRRPSLHHHRPRTRTQDHRRSPLSHVRCRTARRSREPSP